MKRICAMATLLASLTAGVRLHGQTTDAAQPSAGGNVPVPWLAASGTVATASGTPFATEGPFTLDLLAAGGYDNNLYDNNVYRLGDWVLTPGLEASWMQAWNDTLHLALDYGAVGFDYPGYRNLNRLNNGADLHADWEPSARWELRATDATHYVSSLFGYVPLLPSAPNLPSVLPSSGNTLVITPLANVLTDDSRLDASYETSPNGTADVFEEYSLLRYTGITGAATLYDTQALTSGGTYVQQLSPTLSDGPTISATWLHFGTVMQARLVSGLESIGWQPSKDWDLDVFGGAQHMDLHQEAGASLGAPSPLAPAAAESNWHPAFGGAATRNWDRLAATLSGEHTVTDGSGLLGTTLFTDESLTVSLRSPDALANWSGSFVLANGLTQSLAPELPGATVRDLRVGVLLRRQLSDNFSLRFTDAWVEQTAQNLPGYANANRNLLLMGLDWRVAGPPGGM